MLVALEYKLIGLCKKQSSYKLSKLLLSLFIDNIMCMTAGD